MIWVLYEIITDPDSDADTNTNNYYIYTSYIISLSITQEI